MATASYRQNMPLYAKQDAINVSGEQLKVILRGRNPFKFEPLNYKYIYDRKGYRIARLKNGTWWVENFRDGAPLFAPDLWWPISDAAGERAQKLAEFVKTL